MKEFLYYKAKDGKEFFNKEGCQVYEQGFKNFLENIFFFYHDNKIVNND